MTFFRYARIKGGGMGYFAMFCPACIVVTP
nr:MAG TPA: 30S ribosomal protein S11 [Caudoviricetes sp.]